MFLLLSMKLIEVKLIVLFICVICGPAVFSFDFNRFIKLPVGLILQNKKMCIDVVVIIKGLQAILTVKVGVLIKRTTDSACP